MRKLSGRKSTGPWWRTSLQWLMLCAAFMWLVGCAAMMPQKPHKDPFVSQNGKPESFKCGEEKPRTAMAVDPAQSRR